MRSLTVLGAFAVLAGAAVRWRYELMAAALFSPVGKRAFMWILKRGTRWPK